MANKSGTLVILTRKNKFHGFYHRKDDNIVEFPVEVHKLLRCKGNDRFRETSIIEGGFKHISYHPAVEGKTFYRVCIICNNSVVGTLSKAVNEEALQKYRDEGSWAVLEDDTKFKVPFMNGNITSIVHRHNGQFYFVYAYVH
jgi:hypothetical protein